MKSELGFDVCKRFVRQVKIRDEHLTECSNWADFNKLLDKKNLLLSPFCGQQTCEDTIKANSAREEPAESGTSAMGAKTLCIPLNQVDYPINFVELI